MGALSINFWQNPHMAAQTMRKKELQDVLLETGGTILAHGESWTLMSKHLGAGVYRVTVKKR